MITGKNFRSAKVYLDQGSLLKLAAPTAKKVSTDTTLYVTLLLLKIPGGLYNVTTSNSDGVNITAQDSFSVTDQDGSAHTRRRAEPLLWRRLRCQWKGFSRLHPESGLGPGRLWEGDNHIFPVTLY